MGTKKRENNPLLALFGFLHLLTEQKKTTIFFISFPAEMSLKHFLFEKKNVLTHERVGVGKQSGEKALVASLKMDLV